jgi:LacI family transcriptional regulator
MRTGKEPVVMLLLNPGYAYDRALLIGIARYSQLHGPWIFVRESPYWENEPRNMRELLRRVNGIIMIERPLIKDVRKLRIPCVVSNYLSESISGIPNIVSDHRAMGAMAAHHLLERGFRQFAFCGYPGLFWSDQRQEGFERVIQQAGGLVDNYIPPPAGSGLAREKEQRSLEVWLKALPKPVGLMACIDERGQQVAEACKAVSLSIPDKVAIIGVNNDELVCTLSNIPTSSVAISAEQGGFEAAACLHRLMLGHRPKSGKILIHPTHVVARLSTDVIAISDPHVANAVRFIQNACKKPLYVDEVSKAVGLSRRVLEKRFRASLNRTIHEQIRKSRISVITRMLIDSAMSVSEIAFATGFDDTKHIARYFRAETGVSLTAYRRQNHS